MKKIEFNEYEVREVPLLQDQNGETLPKLVGVMTRLLSENGCPWDREQTFESLKKYVLEEACEVIDAIDSGKRAAIKEELGDLLLQIVFQAELARREHSFGIDDVIEGIVSKMVNRHPHVFFLQSGEQSEIKNAEQVLQNWEKQKLKEKEERGEEGKKGVLSGIPRSLSGLTRAQRIGEKVARVGFDWDDSSGSFEKVKEELAELLEAQKGEGSSKEKVEEEFGDVLFALVNYARHLEIDAESSLTKTIDKFRTRFEFVEKRVHEVHGGFASLSKPLPLTVLDSYWDEAKQKEREKGLPPKSENEHV